MGKRNRYSKAKQRVFENLPMDLRVGDGIVVKAGVKDPDYGHDIGGWHDRITEIESYQDGKVTIMFQWDSLSLKAMPASMIRRDEEKGLDWTTMGLYHWLQVKDSRILSRHHFL
jgi:hypothetical protein